MGALQRRQRGTKAVSCGCYHVGARLVCAKAAPTFKDDRSPAAEEIMDNWSSVKLCDVANLILSGILFFSPWLFDLSHGAQWQTASVVGIVIAVLSIAALAAFALWEEWLNLTAGLALIGAPWLLGFQNSGAMTVDVVIGFIVAALAAFEVWIMRECGTSTAASL